MAAAIDRKVEQLHRILAGDPAEEVAVAIVEALSKISSEHSSLLSYKSIANLAKREIDSRELLQSISVLTSPMLNVLIPLYLYIGSDGEEHIIGGKDLAQVRKLGFFVDPHSGEKIENLDEVAFPYFSSTDDFRKLMSAPNG